MTNPNHLFQPTVCVTLRDDGRYDVEFDWADSYLGVSDDTFGLFDDRAPGYKEVCEAVDTFVKGQPTKLIIPPPTEG